MTKWLIILALGTASVSCAAQPAPRTAEWPAPDYGRGQTKTIQADGFEITYLDRGEGPPIVVFMHFWNGFGWWQSFIERAAAQRRVIAPDHNAVSVPRLVALMEAIDAGPVDLVSHSASGWLAIHVAARRPDLIRSLVLVEPGYAPDPQSAAAMAAAYETSCALAEAPEPTLAACRLANGASGRGYYESIPESVRTPPPESSWDANAALKESGIEPLGPGEAPAGWLFPPICEVERQLTMPILFVRGRLSTRATQIGYDAHESCLPRHETAVIDDAAHYVHIDNPDAFSREVLRFMNGVNGL
jgi:pimeloyl-ACP methyl ester carboxylesterase